MGVDDWSGITSWKVSCTGVNSTRLRLISMNVFLMMRLSEASLSISLHHHIPPDALSQADLSFRLLSLCLRGDGLATLEDYIDLVHLVFIVGISLTMFSSMWLLRRWLCWHLLVI
jgi:hypothetical protein